MNQALLRVREFLHAFDCVIQRVAKQGADLRVVEAGQKLLEPPAAGIVLDLHDAAAAKLHPHAAVHDADIPTNHYRWL